MAFRNMYYFSIIALISMLTVIFVVAWQVDKNIEEYSSAIVTQVQKLGLDLEIPNQMPLNYGQKVKIIRDAKQIQTLKNMAQIREFEIRYKRLTWGLVIVCVLGFAVAIAFKRSF